MASDDVRILNVSISSESCSEGGALFGDLCDLVAARGFVRDEIKEFRAVTSLPVSEIQKAETSSSANLLPEANW